MTSATPLLVPAISFLGVHDGHQLYLHGPSTWYHLLFWGSCTTSGRGNNVLQRLYRYQHSSFFTDPFEPDNSALEANLIAHGYSEEHSLHDSTDEIGSASSYLHRLRVTLTTSGPVGGDTYLRLYDSTATTSLAYNDYQGANEYGIITRSLDPGVYYLLVYQGYTSEATPSYTLDTSFQYSTADPLTPDSYENNDTTGSATSLVAGAPQSHSLHREGDVDYFQVTIDGLSRVDIEASGDVTLFGDYFAESRG